MGLKHVSKANLAKKKLGPGLALPWGPGCLAFMLAGHAVTTLVRKSDWLRLTYYVRGAVDDVKQVDGWTKEVVRDGWFVHLLAGADNKRAYKYLGCIDDVHGARRFRTTKGTSKCSQASADNINLIGDTIAWLVDGADAGHKVQVWQRGICGRCCAELTVPSSISTGLGPVCAKHLGIEMKDAAPSSIEQLAALVPVPAVVKKAAQSVGKKLGIPVTFVEPVDPSPAPEPESKPLPKPFSGCEYADASVWADGAVHCKDCDPANPHCEPEVDPAEAAIDSLIEVAGLDPSTKTALVALVAALPKARKAKTLVSLRKKSIEEAA